jgi:hypothetical protein
VAEPVGRRDHRHAAADARRGSGDLAARGAARAVPARPDEEGPRLLQGQPAEGRVGGGLRGRRRAAGPRRADLGARPADGGGLQRLRRGAYDGGRDRPAVEPHPQRGRAVGRQGHDHPRGSNGRDRDARRAAPPPTQSRAGRGVRHAPRSLPHPRRARPQRRRLHGQLHRGSRRAVRAAAGADLRRRTHAHQHATDAGGAVPRSYRTGTVPDPVGEASR